MRLTHLTLCGFRGFLTETEIPFSRGFTVVTGKNGTGKSSIGDGIEYALTQKLSRFIDDTERGEYITDYIWWRDDPRPASYSVELGFSDDVGERFTIKGGPEGFQDGNAAIARLLIGEGPEDAATQLVRTMLLRDETLTKFSTDMSEVARFDFVRRAIGIGGTAELERAAGDLVKRLDEICKAEKLNYEAARDNVAVVSAELSRIRSAAQHAVTATSEEVSKIVEPILGRGPGDPTELMKRIRDGLRANRDKIDRLQATLSLLRDVGAKRQQVEASATRAKVLQNRRTESQKNLDIAGAELQKLKDELDRERAGEPIISSLAELREHGRRVGLVDGKCPLCGSRIEVDDFRAHLDEIAGLVQQHSSRLAETVAAVANSEARVRKLELDQQDIEREYQVMAEAPDQIERQLSALKGRAHALGVTLEESDLLSHLSELRAQTRTLETALTSLESSQTVSKLTELEREVEVRHSESRRAELVLERTMSAKMAAKRVADTVRRVAAEVVDERLANLYPLLSELYTRLRPHRQWTELSYQVRGDLKRFLSFEVGPHINPRFVFSSGQRRVLGLAFLLSVHLSRTWTNLHTLVLDDPVQHVDDFRALHLAETLASIRRGGKQIICMVEDRDLAELLCRRLRAEAGDEGTLVEMGFSSQRGVFVSKIQAVQGANERVLLSA